jgi:hypothetical protein
VTAPERVVTTRPGESSAAACRRLGWGPGTRLVGDEGYGPTVIRLTAIGEARVLAVCEDRNDGYEGSWTLSCRDWQVVDDAPSSTS